MRKYAHKHVRGRLLSRRDRGLLGFGRVEGGVMLVPDVRLVGGKPPAIHREIAACRGRRVGHHVEDRLRNRLADCRGPVVGEPDDDHVLSTALNVPAILGSKGR